MSKGVFCCKLYMIKRSKEYSNLQHCISGINANLSNTIEQMSSEWTVASEGVHSLGNESLKSICNMLKRVGVF